MPADTASLRMPDGFRDRGGQVTRLETFVDAAFAFTLTLVVISAGAAPDRIPALLEALKGVPAFAGCFLLIAVFWHAHARWSRRYGLDDGRTVLLSLALVFLVLIYVYPLKLLFGIFFAWISGGWLPWPVTVIGGYGEIKTMFVVYGLGYAALSACMASLYRHALRQRRALGLDIEEIVRTAADVAAWRLATAIGALSALSTVWIPDRPSPWLSAVPGMIYFLMNLSWPVSGWASARARRRYAGEPPG